MYRISVKQPTPAPRPDRFTWTDEEAAALFGNGEAAQKYDPNQPRHPAGRPDGGRFAPKGGAGGAGGKDGSGGKDGATSAPGDKEPPPRKLRTYKGEEIYVSHKSSLYDHLELQPDGTYRLSKARQKLHDKIVADALAGTTPVDNPALYMMGGGPASGKSTMLEGDLKTVFPKNAVEVNADHVKERLPEYRKYLKTNAKEAAARTHDESSMVGDRIRIAAREGKRNVIYDTTGNSEPPKLKGKLDRFRKAGYTVNAYYATLDTDLAVKLAMIRGEKTGRYVPEHIVRSTHATVSRVFEQAAKERWFDTVQLYDTNVHNKPRLVASGSRSSFEIVNRTLWNDFVNKGKTTPPPEPKRKKADGETHLSTHQLERIIMEILLGVEEEHWAVTGPEADEARAILTEQINAMPEGAEVVVGQEYPDPDIDWQAFYDDEPETVTKSVPEHDGEGIHTNQYVAIKKADDEKQIVYGEVYAPDVLDTYGEFMTAEDIEVMAHRFMQIDLRTAIDTNHDNVPNGAYPIESFIARDGDPDYTPGAWVLGVKIPDNHLWRQVKSGELNGFSFQSLVKPTTVDVEYGVIRDHVGKTEPHDDHHHVYLVELDEIGNVVGGRTSKAADGHFHEIRRASHTEASEGHNHRFFL